MSSLGRQICVVFTSDFMYNCVFTLLGSITNFQRHLVAARGSIVTRKDVLRRPWTQLKKIRQL